MLCTTTCVTIISHSKNNVPALEDVEWVVDRFQKVSHKCKTYAADQHNTLEGVSSESCEQRFVWLRRSKYMFLTMNVVRAFFPTWNVLEPYNLYLHAGRDPQAIVSRKSDPGEREERSKDISTWVICAQEDILARNVTTFLVRHAAALHKAMACATPTLVVLPRAQRRGMSQKAKLRASVRRPRPHHSDTQAPPQ